MGNCLAMKKFRKGESVADIKQKIKDMFDMSAAFVNLYNEEDYMYIGDSNGKEITYDSAFDYEFDKLVSKKEFKIEISEIKEICEYLANSLQQYDEAYSDFVYCELDGENDIAVSMAMICHEI